MNSWTFIIGYVNSDLICICFYFHILRNKLRLADVLKSKTEENEAYLAEIEVVSLLEMWIRSSYNLSLLVIG